MSDGNKLGTVKIGTGVGQSQCPAAFFPVCNVSADIHSADYMNVLYEFMRHLS